jgi:hypothetical protein
MMIADWRSDWDDRRRTTDDRRWTTDEGRRTKDEGKRPTATELAGSATYGRISLRLLLALLLALGLWGCAAEPAEPELAGAGGSSPQNIVESFLEDLNLALADKNLDNANVRRSWAEILAGHFAPSERADQRTAMQDMLAAYADTAARPAVGSKVSLTITFTRTEVISSDDNEALVRVVDGVLVLRWLDESGEVVRERTGGLTELLGQTSGGLPVLRVGGSWFMTEG